MNSIKYFLRSHNSCVVSLRFPVFHISGSNTETYFIMSFIPIHRIIYHILFVFAFWHPQIPLADYLQHIELTLEIQGKGRSFSTYYQHRVSLLQFVFINVNMAVLYAVLAVSCLNIHVMCMVTVEVLYKDEPLKYCHQTNILQI